MDKKRGYIIAVVLIVSLFFAGCVITDPPHPLVDRGKLLSVSDDIPGIPKALIQFFAAGLGMPLDILYGVQAYAITFETIGIDGTSSVESGLVLLPKDESTMASRQPLQVPILSMQHGTIFNRAQSPSRFSMDLTRDNPEDYIGLIFASLGYAVFMPDYSGLGVDDTILHPFCHAQSLSDSVLDMLRAGKTFMDSKSDELIWDETLFLVGYSEGGYATMAASGLIQEEYAQEWTITGTAPMAGPFNLSEVMRKIVVENQYYEHLAYLAYLVYGYDVVYDLFDDPSEIFLNPYDTTIPPLMDGEHDQQTIRQALPGDGAGYPDELFTPALIAKLNDTESRIYQVLQENDLFQNWIPTMPMFLFHSKEDEAVPVENSRTANAFFMSQGAPVTYVELPEGKHVESYLFAYVFALGWLQDLRVELESAYRPLSLCKNEYGLFYPKSSL